MQDKSFSRRQFMKGAAVAVAGASALSACGSDSDSDSTPVQSYLPAKWDAEADVVVIGFGAAGGAAAYEAAAAGAQVMVLDASEAGGGDTAISAGYVFLGGGTGLQAQVDPAYGAETPDQMYKVVRAMGGEGADADIIKTWCQNGKAVYDFLTEQCGVTYEAKNLTFSGMEQHPEFKVLAPNGTPVPHAHQAAGSGAGLFAKLSDAVLKGPHAANVTLKGLTKAVRLVQDPQTKRVVGVVVKPTQQVMVDDPQGSTGSDGKLKQMASYPVVADAPEQFVKARRAVVIASGCFSANREMMAQHDPRLLGFYHFHQLNADGSGIKLGQSVGGDVRFMKGFWAMCFFMFTPGFTSSVLVSPKGQRVCAEDGTFYWLGYHIVAREPTVYAISDATITPTAPAGAVSADTLEGLAAAINAKEQADWVAAGHAAAEFVPPMSAAALAATIAGYNADAAAGKDAQFYKDASALKAVATAPFYAVKHTAKEIQGTTAGGLHVDPGAHLLGADGAAVPGVFAAGTCCSLTISERYTGSGTAIGGALTFGRIAGQGAAAQEPWEG